jgi:hypothetical protein
VVGPGTGAAAEADLWPGRTTTVVGRAVGGGQISLRPCGEAIRPIRLGEAGVRPGPIERGNDETIPNSVIFPIDRLCGLPDIPTGAAANHLDNAFGQGSK